MKSDLLTKLFFILLIAIIPLGYMDAILDNSLLPKFLGLSTLLISTVLLFVFKKVEIKKLNIIDFAILSFFGFHCLSIIWAINSSDAIYESLKIGLLFLLVQCLKPFFDESNKVFEAIGLAALLATILAIGFSVEEVFTALKLKVPFKDANYVIESQFGHKNMFSNWLLFLLPLNLIALGHLKKTPKILIQIIIVFQLLMIILLMTRAVYLAAFITLILYVILKKYKTPSSKRIISYSVYAITAILLIFVVLIAFDKLPIISELNTQSSNSAVERIVIWTKSIGLIKDHFLFGVGAGNWKILLPSQGIEGMRRALDGFTVFARPHNDYLWVWSETGTIGFIAFISFIVVTLKTGFNQIYNSDNYNILMAFLGFVSFLIVAFFDFPKERIESIIALAIFSSIISHEANIKGHAISKATNKSMNILFIAIALFSIYFALIRIDSETNMRIALSEKDKGNYSELIKFSYAAEHKFYQADNNGLPLRYYSGIGHFNLNQKQKAIEDFKIAFELNPYNFNVINNIATAFFISNDYLNAEKYYLEALRINPYFDDARLNLAATYINTNRKEEAMHYLNQVSTNTERLQQLKALAN